MNEKWRQTFIEYAKSDIFKKHVEEAKKIVKDALKKHEKMYIAFSGGRDSTSMMHLIHKIDNSVIALHWDYGRYYIPREIFNEIKNIAKSIGVTLRIETSDKYEILKRNAINVLGEDFIEKLIPKLRKQGFTGVFVGLRKEESIKRKIRISNKTSLTDLEEFYPLQSWTWLDVWAYIVINKIPYISHYDRYCPVIGYDKARFTTLFDPEFDKFGCSNVDGVLSWKWKHEV